MTQIKSEKAKDYAWAYRRDKKHYNDDRCEGAYYGYIAGYNSAQIELSHLHAKELRYIENQFDCDKYHLENNHRIDIQELKDKAVEAHRQCCEHLQPKGYKAYWNNNFHPLGEDKCSDGLNWEQQPPSAKTCDSEYMKSFLNELSQ